MRRFSASLFSLLVLASPAAAQVQNFKFDSPTYMVGALLGQDGWVTFGLGNVSAERDRAGGQSAHLDGGTTALVRSLSPTGGWTPPSTWEVRFSTWLDSSVPGAISFSLGTWWVAYTTTGRMDMTNGSEQRSEFHAPESLVDKWLDFRVTGGEGVSFVVEVSGTGFSDTESFVFSPNGVVTSVDVRTSMPTVTNVGNGFVDEISLGPPLATPARPTSWGRLKALYKR